MTTIAEERNAGPTVAGSMRADQRARTGAPAIGVVRHAACPWVMASTSRLCGIDRLVAEFVDDAALADSQNAIGDLQHFLEIRRHHQHGFARRCHLADQPVDLLLGADIYALSRLIEQKDLSGRRKPLGQHEFLLVAAGKQAGGLERTRRLDREVGIIRAARRNSRADIKQATAHELRERRERHVLRHRHDEREALAAAILGEKRDAVTDGVARPRECHRRAADADFAGAGGAAPKMVSSSSVRPAPTSPVRTRISPRRRAERDVGEFVRARPSPAAPAASRRAPSVVPDARRAAARSRPVMSGHHLAAVERAGGKCPDRSAVAQDGHAIDQRRDLLQPVADIDDAGAGLCQARSSANSFSDSPWLSAAVGSSRMSSFASTPSALAISIN